MKLQTHMHVKMQKMAVTFKYRHLGMEWERGRGIGTGEAGGRLESSPEL